jgi:GrpB-like predicted nucleotidyltransferase (UPF0157 family)
MFLSEAGRLRAVFGDEAVAVHHIGSTSVPGLSAKPIVDFLVEVRDIERVDAYDDALRALGYEARGEFGIPGRRYFPRVVGETHTHHVHCFQAGHPEIAGHLAVRDYLIAHPEAAQAYGRLKEELARRHPWDIDAYVDGKDAFVKDLERRALAWAEATAHAEAGPGR